MEREAVNDVLNILEAKRESDSSPEEADYRVVEHWELFTVLIASGKGLEIIGVSLTQDQVKNLSEQDVEKYFERSEASLSSKDLQCNA